MEGRASHSAPVFARADRVASRAARVAWRYRDCQQFERLIIHSDGGLDVRLRDPRLGSAHQPRRYRANDRSPGTTAEEARPALSRRQVKRNERAADHQVALAAAADSPSTGAQPGALRLRARRTAFRLRNSRRSACPAIATTTSPSSQLMDDDVTICPTLHRKPQHRRSGGGPGSWQAELASRRRPRAAD